MLLQEQGLLADCLAIQEADGVAVKVKLSIIVEESLQQLRSVVGVGVKGWQGGGVGAEAEVVIIYQDFSEARSCLEEWRGGEFPDSGGRQSQGGQCCSC